MAVPSLTKSEGEIGTDNDRGRWMLIGHPDGDGELVVSPEALAAAPEAVREAQQAVFVHDPHEGQCRLCGRVDSMTREHVPPASTQVGGRSVLYTVEEWLARSDDDVLPGGTAQQAGTWTRGLCASCNTKTGS